MVLNTEKSVREYAVETPGATRVFEKLKIDYYCGGRSLSDACAAAGVEVGQVESLLEAASGPQVEMPAAAQSGTLSELIDYIEGAEASGQPALRGRAARRGRVALGRVAGRQAAPRRILVLVRPPGLRVR